MAAVATSQLPFRELTDRAREVSTDITERTKELGVILGDIDAAERNEVWQAAQDRGEKLFEAAVGASTCARYVLNVIEAQHIGNASEAWRVGLRNLREAVEKTEALAAP